MQNPKLDLPFLGVVFSIMLRSLREYTWTNVCFDSILIVLRNIHKLKNADYRNVLSCVCIYMYHFGPTYRIHNLLIEPINDILLIRVNYCHLRYICLHYLLVYYLLFWWIMAKAIDIFTPILFYTYGDLTCFGISWKKWKNKFNI